MRWASGVVRVDKTLHRLFGGRCSLVAVAGLPSLRLISTGRRTGLARATNLLYYPHRGSYVLIGSNWGRRNDPAWTFNLRSDPHATIVVRGRQLSVRASEVSGERYHELWRALLEFWPGYAMEQAHAGRRLPLFVLEEVPG